MRRAALCRLKEAEGGGQGSNPVDVVIVEDAAQSDQEDEVQDMFLILGWRYLRRSIFRIEPPGATPPISFDDRSVIARDEPRGHHTSRPVSCAVSELCHAVEIWCAYPSFAYWADLDSIDPIGRTRLIFIQRKLNLANFSYSRAAAQRFFRESLPERGRLRRGPVAVFG